VAPYPDWSQSDTALASIATLLRGLHDAAGGFDLQGLTWTTVWLTLRAGRSCATTTCAAACFRGFQR
jgi:hypothetical protein